MIEQDLALGNGHALDLDNVLVRVQLDVVAQTDRGNNAAQFERYLSSDQNYTVQQVAALIRILILFATILIEVFSFTKSLFLLRVLSNA